MNLFKTINFTKLKGFIQGESNRNRAALNCLKEIGFSMKEIRHALIRLNGINISGLIDGQQLTPPTLYNTLDGKRQNPQAQSIFSDALGLNIKELFPE
jgi:lambda repressor-like predicted transcriptional regulator